MRSHGSSLGTSGESLILRIGANNVKSMPDLIDSDASGAHSTLTGFESWWEIFERLLLKTVEVFALVIE